MEAFASHPRIGESRAPKSATAALRGVVVARATRRCCRGVMPSRLPCRRRTVNTSDDSGESSLCALPARAAPKFCRFCGIGCRMMTGRKSAKRRSSSGRSVKFGWESGCGDERKNINARARYGARESRHVMCRCVWSVQEAPDRWRLLASARTDQDGRCGQLLPEGESLRAGNYRLSFETGHYFAAQKIEGLYPMVQIVFSVREGETHFHIPLLLSPIRLHDVPGKLSRRWRWPKIDTANRAYDWCA